MLNLCVQVCILNEKLGAAERMTRELFGNLLEVKSDMTNVVVRYIKILHIILGRSCYFPFKILETLKCQCSINTYVQLHSVLNCFAESSRRTAGAKRIAYSGSIFGKRGSSLYTLRPNDYMQMNFRTVLLMIICNWSYAIVICDYSQYIISSWLELSV